jgi:hypothetical protein
MKTLVIRKLIVDEHNELFDAQGMRYLELPSDYRKVRDYAALILEDCPGRFREGNLLEQQLSEIIKNGIKHGNGCDPAKKLRIWYDLRKRARFIIEDEGEGFRELEQWNDFFRRRQTALFNQDFDGFLDLASYRGPRSTEEDGGNSLIAALEYWNGGMIFNRGRNKVGVVRWFAGGSEPAA